MCMLAITTMDFFENTKILNFEANYKKLLISEMIHIMIINNSINKKEYIYALNHMYNPVFQNLKP